MTLKNTMNKINASNEAEDMIEASEMAFRYGLEKARRIVASLSEREEHYETRWYRILKCLNAMTASDVPTQ
jgi:hypothetical protein